MADGDTAALLDRFRYNPIDPVILAPGQLYTVGFYAGTFAASDGMVTDANFEIQSPIQYVDFGVSNFTSGIHIPTTPNTGSLRHRFGANFQFTTVPTPATAAVLLTPAILIDPRRRKR